MADVGHHMSMKLLLGFTALLAVSFSSFAQSFYLKDGDRVVFYGDSITDQRLYTTFTETYVVTRFPKMNVTFVHSGWGGDRVGGGGGGKIETRLQRDVVAYNPTVMTIMLGMNDASYRPYEENIFQTYKTGYERIIRMVKEKVPNIRITVIQPSPYEDVAVPPKFEGGYNAVLQRYGEFVKELAKREGLIVADMNQPVVDAVKAAVSKDPELAKKINPDRIHPGTAGHLLMAGQLLKAWNAPSIVTRVQIDAKTGTLSDAQKTRVGRLQKGEEGLSWTQLDECLPMPIDFNDPVVSLAINSSDFVESLNQQVLQVTGLDRGDYKLLIDGTSVKSFSAGELAKGVNLSTISTPMLKQAQQVHRLTLEHNNVHFTRWRQVQVPFGSHKSEKVRQATEQLVKAFDEQEEELVQQQRNAAQPKERKYTLQKE